ncbi:hypothetical protein [Hymenobacter sp. UYCo722]|uniref:hypothetical protein n=1 Tax=Hymenobacter sp. UYCo722 TaxID=3156335 RepID=UPI0033955CA2
MKIVYETPNLTIQHDTVNACLFLTWRGQNPTKLIKATSEIILQQIQLTRSTNLLNDASLDLDGWGEFVSWFGHELFPKLTATGIQAIAWVLPHNLRALADTKNVLNLIEHSPDYRPDCPETNTFGDVDSAYRWLQQLAASR